VDSPDDAAPRSPQVLIPVSAEDFSRRKRRIALSALFAVVVGVVAAGLAYKRLVDPIHAKQSYDAGVRLLDVARYDQAVLAFDRAVGLKADFADAYLMRGRARVGQFRTDQAIRDFTKLIELRPNDPQVWVTRCSAFLSLKRYPQAIGDATRALELDGHLALAYNLRGSASRAIGDTERALEDFNRAVDLAPNEDNYYQRGATYKMLNDHRHAIADLDRVIGLHPDAPLAYLARAESRRALGDFEGAHADQIRAEMIEGR
jgi:tetratricopeptide (TPR) repeat protein